MRGRATRSPLCFLSLLGNNEPVGDGGATVPGLVWSCFSPLSSFPTPPCFRPLSSTTLTVCLLSPKDDASTDGDGPATGELRAQHVGDWDADEPRPDHNGNSESEGYSTQPVESDEEPSPVKGTVSGTDNEDEPPVKDDVGTAEGQGSSSDEEEGPKMAADSDSDQERDRPLAGSPSRRSTPDSDLDPEMPARPPSAPVDSEEEEQGEQEPAGGADGLRWKAVMQSDSEDDVMTRKTSRGNDEEQQEDEEHRNTSGQPGTSLTP